MTVPINVPTRALLSLWDLEGVGPHGSVCELQRGLSLRGMSACTAPYLTQPSYPCLHIKLRFSRVCVTYGARVAWTLWKRARVTWFCEALLLNLSMTVACT